MKVKVSYFEMLSPQIFPAVPEPDKRLDLNLQKLNTKEYLQLYKKIGEKYQWDTRLTISEQELAEILESNFTEIFLLTLAGDRIGMCEFDSSALTEIEIKHFGIIESAQGKGIGSYFLDAVLRKLWQRNPSRIWLHTDSNDHPNAIPTYERAGFIKYKEQEEEL